MPFPARKPLRDELGNLIGDTRQLGANRGSQKFQEMSDIYENMSDVYYEPNQSSPSRNMEDVSSPYSVAFVDTDIPTSSTDYSRPRTVAAGYDPERKTMTVVFRDGTFYNYYEVNLGEWQAFKASVSKGNPWLNKANKNQGSDGLFVGKPRGPADVSNISAEVRELLYRVVRTSQIYHRKRLNKTRTTRAVATKVNKQLARKYKSNPGKNPSA